MGPIVALPLSHCLHYIVICLLRHSSSKDKSWPVLGLKGYTSHDWDAHRRLLWRAAAEESRSHAWLQSLPATQLHSSLSPAYPTAV